MYSRLLTRTLYKYLSDEEALNLAGTTGTSGWDKEELQRKHVVYGGVFDAFVRSNENALVSAARRAKDFVCLQPAALHRLKKIVDDHSGILSILMGPQWPTLKQLHAAFTESLTYVRTNEFHTNLAAVAKTLRSTDRSTLNTLAVLVVPAGKTDHFVYAAEAWYRTDLGGAVDFVISHADGLQRIIDAINELRASGNQGVPGDLEIHVVHIQDVQYGPEDATLSDLKAAITPTASIRVEYVPLCPYTQDKGMGRPRLTVPLYTIRSRLAADVLVPPGTAWADDVAALSALLTDPLAQYLLGLYEQFVRALDKPAVVFEHRLPPNSDFPTALFEQRLALPHELPDARARQLIVLRGTDDAGLPVDGSGPQYDPIRWMLKGLPYEEWSRLEKSVSTPLALDTTATGQKSAVAQVKVNVDSRGRPVSIENTETGKSMPFSVAMSERYGTDVFDTFADSEDVSAKNNAIPSAPVRNPAAKTTESVTTLSNLKACCDACGKPALNGRTMLRCRRCTQASYCNKVCGADHRLYCSARQQ